MIISSHIILWIFSTLSFAAAECKFKWSSITMSSGLTLPQTCDDPKWEFLGKDAVDHFGSSGPWDCAALEREFRFNCTGCECKLEDKCTDERKETCRSRNQESCTRGLSICGTDCIKGYTKAAGVCKPQACDDAAKEACKNANKNSCTGGSFECGGCLDGFTKVADICVDNSKCTNSDVPSKMVMLMDTSGSLDNPLYGGRYGNFRDMKNLAIDLVNVFPINEYAIRSFSTDVTPYPASGEFVDRAEARRNIESMLYDNGGTQTGDAFEHTINLLENETDSFNIVLILTDGRASDYACPSGETCDMEKQKCVFNESIAGSGQSCKLQVQAPRLQELPDRNETVTVVSVGFGQINADELRFMASGEGDNNTIIAQGKDASDGLDALQKLLGSLVEKVCLNLPVDCVVGYSDWSECPDECGQQYQFSDKQILVESKNGGKACPDSKQMLIRKIRECANFRECTTTPSNTTKETTTIATTDPTTSETSTSITTTSSTTTREETTTSGQEVATESTVEGDPETSTSAINLNQNSRAVSDGLSMVNTFTWTLATTYSFITMFSL